MWPDYIKMLVEGVCVERLLNHAELDFKCDLSSTTAEINDKKMVSQYRFGKITICKSSKNSHHVMFAGSVHKLWNDLVGVRSPDFQTVKTYSGFNGNQFSFDALDLVKADLCKLFDCSTTQMTLQNIEFGMNVSVPFDPKLFIKGLLFHNGKMFEYRYAGNYAQVIHQQYIGKLYNKSFQYGMDESILRIELKVIKMAALRNFGIITLNDLQPDKMQMLLHRLSEFLSEIVYYDYTIRRDSLETQETIFADNYSNPRYWFDQLEPNRRDRHKRRLNELIKQHSDNLKTMIQDLMVSDCVTINQPLERRGVITNHSNIELSITNNSLLDGRRKCQITGLDITMQMQTSKHLSHTGLNFYFINDIVTFNGIRSRYLSDKWKKESFKIQIQEIAHNIRNAASNQRMKHQRLYPVGQIQLF